MRYGFWTICLAAALTVAAAAQGVGDPPPAPEGITTHTLGNGLRLIYQPRYELEFTYVSVYLPLPAGWLSRGRQCASWLEALYLDTGRPDEDTPREALATLDAVPSVRYDGRHVVFDLVCRPEGLPRALSTLMDTLFTDRVQDPFWAQAAARIRLRAVRARTLGWEAVRDDLTTEVLAGGRMERVQSLLDATAPDPLALAALRAHLADPGQIRIVVTGRGDAAEAANLLAQRASGWPSPPADPIAASTAAGAPLAFAQWDIPVDPPRVVVCYQGPGWNSARLGAFLLSASLLADGLTSVAGRQYRQGSAWVPVLVRSGFRVGRDRSVFTVELQCPTESFDAVEGGFFAAAELVASGRWLDVDQERARHQAFTHLGAAIAEVPVFHEVILERGQPIRSDWYTDWRRRLAAPNRREIADAAKSHLTLNHALVLELPGGGGRQIMTPAAFRQVLSTVLPNRVDAAARALKDTPDIPLAVPEFDPEPEFNAEKMDRIVTSGILRGPSAYLKEFHRFPLVWVRAGYPGGVHTEPADKPGLNRLALWSRFLACRDNQDRLLLERLEMLGARIGIEAGPELTFVTLICPAYFRQPALSVFFRILHRHSPSDTDLTRAAALAPLFVDHPDRIPAQAVLADALRALYGPDSPYARWSAGTAAAIDGPALRAHYDACFYRNPPVMAMVGRFAGTELLSPITDLISTSEFVPFRPPAQASAFALGKIPDQPSTSCAVVSLLLPGPYGGERDILRLELLRQLYLKRSTGGPPVAVEMESQPLSGRGYIHLQFVAESSGGWQRQLAALREWLNSLPERPLNLWQLASAIKLAELGESIRLASPEALTRWLVLNGLWETRLWDGAEIESALRIGRREQVRELVSRFWLSPHYAVAARSLDPPASDPVIAPGVPPPGER
ncbi:MAG TPA: insulinase family protein [Acidobacteriota bacterium]|nr:insulinase family protein [Acidobacteriota bacterium]HQF86321.1 insulinase family protein [Acidobacteriota bacterium]HQG90436.1 insulinase family protein [Acidobacteriota bacterium]HQK87176.1 insulinase family protein [Acidobacteriota bacterium]